MTLKHHHLIYQAKVRNNNHSEGELEQFLYDLVDEIETKVLIPAQLKFSHQKAWTGLMGIVTSHISFHHWTIDEYLQLDIYSCKEFNKEKTIIFINDFWDSYDVRTLFIDREPGKDYKIALNP